MLSAGPMSKPEARRFVAEHGFPDHFNTGECGDGGYGSRLYFRRGPEAPKNEAGWPIETATISRLGRVWHATIFEGAAR